MKRTLTKGRGINGMSIYLNISDMFAIGTVLSEVSECVNSLTEREKYNKLSVEEKKTTTEPQKKHISKDTLMKLESFLTKFTYNVSNSNVFERSCETETVDEMEYEEDRLC